MDFKETELFTKDSQQKSKDRSKSPLRLKYEAEVRVIQKKLGNLEEIREKLGLSQRKICQLLMVDPSAWTRWTKTESEGPPHIYRSLQWYMALNDKYPDLSKAYWLQSVARVHNSESPTHSWNIEKHLLKKQIIEELQKDYEFTSKKAEQSHLTTANNSKLHLNSTNLENEGEPSSSKLSIGIDGSDFLSDGDSTDLSKLERVSKEYTDSKESDEIKARYKRLFDQDFVSGAIFVGFIVLSLFILLYRHIF